MSDLRYRRATAADLPAIIALLADDALGRSRDDASLPLHASYFAAFAAIDRDPNQLYVLVERDGGLAGCCQITFIPGLSRRGRWRGLIESVRVAARLRGQGIGRQMLTWAIGECRARGCRVVQLTTDKTRTDAIRFYLSLGFTASHEGMKMILEPPLAEAGAPEGQGEPC